MIQASIRVWVCLEPTDMRRGFDRLALHAEAIVGDELHVTVRPGTPLSGRASWLCDRVHAKAKAAIEGVVDGDRGALEKQRTNGPRVLQRVSGFRYGRFAGGRAPSGVIPVLCTGRRRPDPSRLRSRRHRRGRSDRCRWRRRSS